MIAIWGILAALVILGYWTLVLWIGGRSDAKHLERERLERLAKENADG